MCDKCGCGKTNKQQTVSQKVADVIDSVIQPALQGHGGSIELVGVDKDNKVSVRLQGACQGCPGAAMTMRMGVERILKERIPEVKEVIAVD